MRLGLARSIIYVARRPVRAPILRKPSTTHSFFRRNGRNYSLADDCQIWLPRAKHSKDFRSERSLLNSFQNDLVFFNVAIVARMASLQKEYNLCVSRRAACNVARVLLIALSITVPGIASLQAHGYDNDSWRQRQEQEREAREREREAREREREAREQAERAKELQEQHENLQKSGSSKSNENYGSSSNWQSSTSSTSDKASSGSSGSNTTVKRSGSSSTSDSYDKSYKRTQSNSSREEIKSTNEPPRTVEKWLKQLSAPKAETEPKAVPIEKPKPAAVAPQQQNTATAKSLAAPTPKGVPKTPLAKASTGGTPEPIEFLDVPLPEVLAVNATSATLAQAKSLGFKAAAPTSLASLDMSVTRLLPPKGMSTADAQALLRAKLPGASFAQNLKYRIYKTASSTETTPSGVPPTPSAEQQQTCAGDRCFAQNIIGWKPELRKCASGLKVGIIDTSVDTSHPAFKRKQIEVRHFGPKDRPGPDWHGTGVAALLAGDDKSSTPGLIPDASFYVADIFYAGEDKGPTSDTLNMLRAFDWLEAKGVKIINMSLSGPPDALIEDAVAKLAAKGVLLVAAAGNDGPNNTAPSYPAAYDDVIAVTAVNKKMQNYRYANRGNFVDVAAPGVAIWTALPGSQQAYHSGTSFATPYVTASLAAIYARVGQTPKAALQALDFRDLGEAGTDPVYGRGLLIAPTSCTGGAIASAPERAPAAAAAEPATFFGLFAPSSSTSNSPASAPDHGEELPWLSLSGPRN